MLKSFGRIGKDKVKLEVEFTPISMSVYSNAAFNFKLRVQRGDQKPNISDSYKVERSLRATDTKLVQFGEKEKIIQPCSFFVDGGVPEKKTATLSIYKELPSNKEECIAKAEINFSEHFGDQFNNGTVEFEKTDEVGGSICKSLTFQASVTCPKAKYRPAFDQCVEWRAQRDEAEAEMQRLDAKRRESSN